MVYKWEASQTWSSSSADKIGHILLWAIERKSLRNKWIKKPTVELSLDRHTKVTNGTGVASSPDNGFTIFSFDQTQSNWPNHKQGYF